MLNTENVKGESTAGLHRSDVPGRRLDGLTLFRFAHMWRQPSSGGVEGYLHNLNRVILERNRMQILQMYLSPGGQVAGIEVERIGLGEVVWIPSPYEVTTRTRQSKTARVLTLIGSLRRRDYTVNHDRLMSVLETSKVDLAAFHWISEDSVSVMDCLRSRHVPCVLIHHFDNKMLNSRRIHKQIGKMAAIGGVTVTGVPGALRERFANLSDAIDTEFFSADAASPVGRERQEPVILLPSRVYREKGHIDAVRVLGELKRRGVTARLVFAGRIENEQYLRSVLQVAEEWDVCDCVSVLGEIAPSQLRDWYAAASVVVLPSAAEGLPRVLLEAQSTGTPVVAYNVGGVAEALLDGCTGWLVEVGNVERLTQRIALVLADHGAGRPMGRHAREFITAGFSLDGLAGRHERFYAAAIPHTR